MNLPVQTTRGATAAQHPQRPSSALSKHLGAYLASRRLPLELRTFWHEYGHITESDDHRYSWAADFRREKTQAAAEAAKNLPARADLEALRRRFEEAATGHATRPEIASIVGAMLDGIASFNAENSGGAVDAICFAMEIECAVKPFSADALAAGALHCFMTAKFAPTPGELLEATRERQEGFANFAHMLLRVLAVLDVVESEGAAAIEGDR